MFEGRVRLITSYNYSSDLYERVLNKKHIIIYGASVAGRQIKDALLRAGRSPLFFWDMNPTAEVEGFEVRYPDFEAIDKADRAEYLVILAVGIGKNGYWSIREKLEAHGYTEYIHSPALLWHINAMNCFLEGKDTQECKSCPQLYWQCFCLNDKYALSGFDKDKLLWPCIMSVKYESLNELYGLAGRCEKFCGYFSATQTVLIKYKALDSCDDGLYSLICVLIEKVKVGIVQILCGGADVLPAELLHRLERFNSRVHFLVDHENAEMHRLLACSGFSYETTENTGFEAGSVKDCMLQCADCVFGKVLYHLNGGSEIGCRCEEMFDIVRGCGTLGILDIDAEQSPHGPDFARVLENIASAEYHYGKCGRKTVIRKGV